MTVANSVLIKPQTDLGLTLKAAGDCSPLAGGRFE